MSGLTGPMAPYGPPTGPLYVGGRAGIAALPWPQPPRMTLKQSTVRIAAQKLARRSNAMTIMGVIISQVLVVTCQASRGDAAASSSIYPDQHFMLYPVMNFFHVI